MNFSFHPDAELELNHAIDYYEDQQNDLGREFAQEVHITILRIIDFPNAWQAMTSQTRRCLCNRFPFAIVYQIIDFQLIIVAVMHQNQKPFYWNTRT